MAPSKRHKQPRSRLRYYLGGVAVAIIALVTFAIILHGASAPTAASVSSSSTSSIISQIKPVILYINQGNGVVNQSNFGSMLSFAISHGFNTIFFQMYRSGVILFTPAQLTSFVAEAHQQHLKIFFALYFTNSSQQIPTQIYPLGEDGISLDMSTLPFPSQQALLSTLQGGYDGASAITTTDMTLPLTPDMLILETYGVQYQQYIHPGIIASVGVFTTTSKADYQEQFQYALDSSDGVMVFDYAGLMKSGY